MPQTLREAIRTAQAKFDLEVRDMVVARPDLSYRDIGRVFGVSYDVVQRVVNQFGLKGKRHTGETKEAGGPCLLGVLLKTW